MTTTTCLELRQTEWPSGAVADRVAVLELWQTEWCPASHRVHQRLTELGLSYLARPVRSGA